MRENDVLQLKAFVAEQLLALVSRQGTQRLAANGVSFARASIVNGKTDSWCRRIGRPLHSSLELARTPSRRGRTLLDSLALPPSSRSAHSLRRRCKNSLRVRHQRVPSLGARDAPRGSRYDALGQLLMGTTHAPLIRIRPTTQVKAAVPEQVSAFGSAHFLQRFANARKSQLRRKAFEHRAHQPRRDRSFGDSP